VAQDRRIVGLAVLASIVYGILHDQITARICVEYFTIGHARIIPSRDPTILGLVWGVVATWHVGTVLGVGLAYAARRDPENRRTARQLIRPVFVLMLCSAVFATAMGLLGYLLASNGSIWLVGGIAERVPPEKHIGFLTDLWAHNASYSAGIVGGIVLMVAVRRSRKSGSMPGRQFESENQ